MLRAGPQGSSDLQLRQSPALLRTGSLKALELKHWLPEQKSVVGEHMAGVSLSPHLGHLQGLLHALTASGATGRLGPECVVEEGAVLYVSTAPLCPSSTN